MCDKNKIGRENTSIKMKTWKRKNIRRDRLEKKMWDVACKEGDNKAQ